MQFNERLVTDRTKDIGLVFEVKVNGAGRVLDFVRNFADRDIIVSLFYEQRARRLQDFLSEVLFTPRSSFLRSHLLNAVHYDRARSHRQELF